MDTVPLCDDYDVATAAAAATLWKGTLVVATATQEGKVEVEEEGHIDV